MAPTGTSLGMTLDTEFNSLADLPSREWVEGAILAEREGFACVWKNETNSRDPMVLLSAMAARTSRVQLGTAICHLYGRSPVTLALQAATLNDLSGGRLILGLGIASPRVAAWHGQVYEKPLRQMREYVEVLRAAYAGQRVDYPGDYFRSAGFQLGFQPSPHPLRLWIAALGPQMSRLAGRISDGILVNLANAAQLREIVANFQGGARAAGRDVGRLEVVVKVRVSIDPDPARARSTLKRVLASYAMARGYGAMFTKMGWGSVVEAVQEAHRQQGLAEASKRVPDAMVEDAPMVAGPDLDALRAKLAAYQEAGATRGVVACAPSSTDPWKQLSAFLEQAGALRS